MKYFLNENNPLVAVLSSLGDLIVLNALFLISSIPLVTIGASITAAFRTALALHNQTCSSITKEFFHTFKSSFRQATAVWCCSLPVFLLLGVYYLLAITNPAFSMNRWLLLVLVLCIVLLAALCYLFPLIGRYQNALRDHWKNAIILAVSNFPRTVLLVLICIIPILLILCSPGLFFYGLPFWVLIGFAALIRAAAFIFAPIANQLDKLSANSKPN